MTEKRIRNLDLATLRSFATIAEAGSMTRAAKRLFMTQSAISMQIKRLEENLGFILFERSPHGMSPTTEGEQLLSYAQQMLTLNDEIWGRLTSPDFEGKIRFGVPLDIIYPHIPRVLKDFSRDFPRIQIQFSSALTNSLKQQFHAGEQDIILTTEKQPDPNGTLLSCRKLVWFGAEDGNAWKKTPLPLGFSRHCAFRKSATESLDKAGIEWIDIVASDDFQAGQAMTSADLCVLAELEDTEHPSLEAIPHGGQLPELPEYAIAMYCSDETNPLAQTLASYLIQAWA